MDESLHFNSDSISRFWASSIFDNKSLGWLPCPSHRSTLTAPGAGMLGWRPHRLLLCRRMCVLHTISARQPTVLHTPLSTSDFRIVRSQTSASTDGRSRVSQGYSEFSPPFNKGDVASWAALIEPFLPGRLRSALQGEKRQSPNTADTPTSTLSVIILEARRQSNHDLLAYLALQQGRWEAMRWVADAVIETCRDLPRFVLGREGLSTLTWPEDQSLDLITRHPFYFDNDASHPLTSAMQLRHIDPAIPPTRNRLPQSIAHLVIGQVWQSLGRLASESANCDVGERERILSNVLQVLASLNRDRYIPNTLCTSTPNDDPSALQQPLPFRILSHEMLASLTDIDGRLDNHSLNTPSIQSHNGLDSLGFPNNVAPSGLRFGAKLWLEFILWCCVHGQWILDGASIVAEMRKVGGPNRWSLVCRRNHDELESLDTTKKYAISVEVVAALVDGLTALSPKRGDRTAPSVVAVVDKILVLKRMLDHENLGLGFSTWDAVVSRFADSPTLISLERNPGMMEIVLGLAESYGKELKSKNAVPHNVDSSEGPKAYIFDASAVVIGLYHRTLHALVRSRDVEGALRVWGRLQALTDTNKARSLREFFAKLLSTRSLKVPTQLGGLLQLRLQIEALFPGVEFPAYFNEIPKPIMADLLDLMVDSDNLELASWMVYSNDLDGPLIPETLYADQIIAPSLIRYAAVAHDMELLRKIRRSETKRLSGKTLVALCDNRIQSANFSDAMDILSMINDYSLYQWTAFDLTPLFRSLILQIFGQHNSRDLDNPTSRHAAALLQRLLRGEFGQVWGTSFAQLDTMAAILSSLDSYLSELCANVVESGDGFRIDLPTGSFNVLLEGVARVWGCRKAQQVYSDWCVYKKDRHISDQKGFQIEPNKAFASVSEYFSAPDQAATTASERKENKILFQGEITPNIATIRVVIQAALADARDDSEDQLEAQGTDLSCQKEENSAHEVLQWAEKVLIGDFGLSEIDVEYELQGYFSQRDYSQIAQDMYSRQTLKLWTAFSGSYRAWALARESELRIFAASKNERQIVLDPPAPAERSLIHSLANDYGLLSESIGDEPERSVRVFKADQDPRVPLKTVDEALGRWSKITFRD